MEMIRINDRKLKITLTTEDMNDYLPPQKERETPPTEEEIRDLLHTLLGRAREETGFEIAGTRVYIQYFPARSGGGEFFITKIGCPALPESETAVTESRPVCSLPAKGTDDASPRTARLPEGRCGRTLAYRFGGIEDLLAVCRRLKRSGPPCTSDAWHDGRGGYYLLLYGIDVPIVCGADDLTFILEYGEATNAEHARLFLCEHGRILCRKDAVGTLARF